MENIMLNNTRWLNAGRHRFAIGGVVAVLIAAILFAVLSRPQADNSNKLSNAIFQTIKSKGIDAAEVQFRALREQRFKSVSESEADTNGLGYKLLNSNQMAAAIRVFELNAETHPASANVHDSLGEAYMRSGHKVKAIESYERALAINPRLKTAASDLQRLGGRPRPPYSAIVLFHIVGGTLGILAGALAMCLKKGSGLHRTAGNVFVVAMLCMSVTGAFRAYVAPQGDPLNVLMGLFTAYLVTTAWVAGRRRQGAGNLFDWMAILLGAGIAAGLIGHWLTSGRFASVSMVFGLVAIIAVAGDVRMIVQGGVTGVGRIVRHLWRMCMALIIASSAFFLGQTQVFSYEVRSSGLLSVPIALAGLSLLYWLVRVRLPNASRIGSAKATG